MKKILIFSMVIEILVLSGCAKIDEEIIEEIKVQDEKIVEEDLTVGENKAEKVYNDEVIKKEDVNKNKETTDKLGDWKTYKNEKYGYSFKYPKDWYIYEYEDYEEKCPTESSIFGEGVIVLSKNELKGCEIVKEGNYNNTFGGDILFGAADKGGSVNRIEQNYWYISDGKMHPIKEFVKYSNEDEEETIIGNGIRSIKNFSLPVEPSITSFYFRVAKFNYGIMIKQLDTDPDFNKFLDSIVIEDYYCETDNDCAIKEEKDTCLECDKKMVCVNKNSEIDKVEPMCGRPNDPKTCINSVVPTGCKCVNNICKSD